MQRMHLMIASLLSSLRERALEGVLGCVGSPSRCGVLCSGVPESSCGVGRHAAEILLPLLHSRHLGYAPRSMSACAAIAENLRIYVLQQARYIQDHDCDCTVLSGTGRRFASRRVQSQLDLPAVFSTSCPGLLSTSKHPPTKSLQSHLAKPCVFHMQAICRVCRQRPFLACPPRRS